MKYHQLRVIKNQTTWQLDLRFRGNEATYEVCIGSNIKPIKLKDNSTSEEKFSVNRIRPSAQLFFTFPTRRPDYSRFL